MALYLGNKKVKINLDGVVWRLNLFSTSSVTNTGWLSSSDNYILQDFNGVYLIPKDYTEIISDNVILSSDNCMLKDSKGLYLIIKESK